MATGDVIAVLRLADVTSLPATLKVIAGGINGGNAVNFANPQVVAFPADVIRYAAWAGVMPGSYAGAALKLRCAARAGIGVVGAARIEAAFYRQSTTTTLSASKTFVWRGITWASPATLGQPVYGENLFTAAQADGVAAGDEFLVMLRRKTDDALDTLAGSLDLSTLVLLSQ
jgi:hypothetical protein